MLLFYFGIRKAMSSGHKTAIAGAMFSVLLMVTSPVSGLGQDASDITPLLNALTVKGFDEKAAAVEALAQSGKDEAETLLEMLLEGRLYTRKDDGKVVVADKRDKIYLLFDPLELTEIGEVSKREIKKIRVNNRLRKIIRSELGRLTLLSPDPAQRMKAARALFQKPSITNASILRTALEQETNAKVHSAIAKALAATDLGPENPVETRMAAITVLRSFVEPEVRSLLSALLSRDDSGKFHDQDEDVRAAAKILLETIESKLRLYGIIENLFHGISLGSVLLLAAIGLAITFGVMGVINMAHGEMVMLGAYTTFIVQELFRNYFPGAFDFSLLIAIPMAFLVSGLAGICIERGIIRFLYGRPLETLLATWGLSLILQQLVRTIFGPTNREVGAPSWMMGAVDLSGGIVLPYNRIYIILFSIIVLTTLLLALRHTTFGLRMRAVTQNRSMAGAMGIKTGRIDALTFGLGCGIAGMAGVALSQIDNVSPNLGQAYIIDSFMVVVFGGVGNLWGTLVGAMSLGVVNKMLEPYAGAVLGKILVLVFIILFIQKKPRGLFAIKGRAVGH